MHVWMCINCRRFENQIGKMRHLLRRLGPHDKTGTAYPLSTEAHKRISKVIFGQYKGTFKNSEFAQMKGAGKISQRRIGLICQQARKGYRPRSDR